MEVEFRDRAFCFTGGLSELKRTQAERETRARGGVTMDVVNDRLDYLVIGSVPSAGWKHGSYGNKIQKGRDLKTVNKRCQLVLLPEVDFMDALANTTPTVSGDVDEKMCVCNYKFVAPPDGFDADALEIWLAELSGMGCHVSVTSEDAFLYQDLYTTDEEDTQPAEDNAIVVRCRIIKQLALNFPSADFVDTVARGFERIRGVDGSLRSFERTEGTAAYMRLLKEANPKARFKS
jgi:hypothetical protein